MPDQAPSSPRERGSLVWLSPYHERVNLAGGGVGIFVAEQKPRRDESSEEEEEDDDEEEEE